MKLQLETLVLAAAFVVVAAGSAFSQTAQAAAGAQSQSGSVSGAGAQASNVNIYESTPRDQNGVALGSSDNRLVSEIRNVPAVSPPAVFGGGHPCIAGKSGGIALPGAGLSYGQGDAEPVCMLMVLGQPEAAIRLLVSTNSGACEAMGNVGYYRVGNSVVPFKCGDTVPGGVETAGVSSRPAKTKSSRSLPYSKCDYDRSTNKLKIKYRFGVDKAAAKATCLRSHGF